MGVFQSKTPPPLSTQSQPEAANADAIRLTEELLTLVKSITSPLSPKTNADARTVHDAKLKAQHVCNHILRELMGPLEYTAVIAESCQESSALQFVAGLGIADLLGEETKSLIDLSDAAGVDPVFLSVAMNCVMGRGFFEEVGFGSQVYRNTELSRLLGENHPTSMKAAVGLAADDALRAAPFLLEAAKPAEDGQRRLPAYNHAFDFTSTIFEWMSTPEQAWRGKRVGKAMQQLHGFSNKHVPEDYLWNELATPIVDCGGGIGSLEMLLLKEPANDKLSFVLFDIPKTIENAKKEWSTRPIEMSSRISFVGGSFLDSDLSTSNIPQNQPTYLIRHVLHDWTDTEVVSILSNVRSAMSADASTAAKARKLLVCEMLLPERPTQFVRQTSMQLLTLNNGFVRTQAHMVRLIEQAGFKVEKVHYMRAVDSIIEATVP